MDKTMENIIYEFGYYFEIDTVESVVEKGDKFRVGVALTSECTELLKGMIAHEYNICNKTNINGSIVKCNGSFTFDLDNTMDINGNDWYSGEVENINADCLFMPIKIDGKHFTINDFAESKNGLVNAIHDYENSQIICSMIYEHLEANNWKADGNYYD